MNRTTVFAAAVIAGVILLIIAILYWTGATGLGQHLKHGILFFALAVVAFLFAAASRPNPGRS